MLRRILDSTEAFRLVLHVDLDDFWREAITRINSLGSQAVSYTTNLRSLIDSSPVSFDPSEIWPVIVAAGKGTRAAETGIDVPKPVAPIDQTAAILHGAQGGLAITASHNPPEWNALKFIGADGTFLGSGLAREMLDIYHQGEYVTVGGHAHSTSSWERRTEFSKSNLS